MTTLAIVGSGILGRSLLYTLAKEKKSYEKITVFSSETFTFPCSLHSTAIVAPRGLSRGHSPLGDLLLESFSAFKEHVELDSPLGVQKVSQWTGAIDKLDTIKKRYPHGHERSSISGFTLKENHYLAQDEAFMIDPATYMDWLLRETKKQEHFALEVIDDLVIGLNENEQIHLTTQSGRNLAFDKVVFAGGYYNHFWLPHAPESKLKTSKPVQGSYLEFNHVPWSYDSFSLTCDDKNLIWNNSLKRLLIGSSSQNVSHVMPDMNELKDLYHFFKELAEVELPEFSLANIKVGIREKAQKREPYVVHQGRATFMGGLYKNGYSLSLKMSKDLSHQSL